MGFVSATKLPIRDNYHCSPSPDEPPPEPDIDTE